jgi:homoserine dehydrogenase
MKTTILANTLLTGLITPQMVLREGIRNLSIEEIRDAASEGNPIRLVSASHLKNEAIIAEVRPQRITKDDILYVGKGTTGVISLETEAMGTITLIEHEPEVLQTAYGVLSDLITIIRQRNQ